MVLSQVKVPGNLHLMPVSPEARINFNYQKYPQRFGVNAGCSQSSVKSKDVCMTVKTVRVYENVYECVYCCRPWVSFHGGGWRIWKAVNVSKCHVRLNWFLDKVRINTCPRTVNESCGAWLKKWGCVFFLSWVLKRGRGGGEGGGVYLLHHYLVLTSCCCNN